MLGIEYQKRARGSPRTGPGQRIRLPSSPAPAGHSSWRSHELDGVRQKNRPRGSLPWGGVVFLVGAFPTVGACHEKYHGNRQPGYSDGDSRQHDVSSFYCRLKRRYEPFPALVRAISINCLKEAPASVSRRSRWFTKTKMQAPRNICCPKKSPVRRLNNLDSCRSEQLCQGVPTLCEFTICAASPEWLRQWTTAHEKTGGRSLPGPRATCEPILPADHDLPSTPPSAAASS